ncbi:hypothetical protein [Marinilabilia salmonicolor]|uniref:Transglutaminase superfamily protein n=1 Tax=Marinilabilia salmonicolor TaxID=989 RepID=A0A368UIS0_9BACT|nr:hypothetical protein [Marinilabilia salmonicolor]RCW20254.1 hypothetical protein DFO77_1651 [Marinilabilia salmonicolor]
MKRTMIILILGLISNSLIAQNQMEKFNIAIQEMSEMLDGKRPLDFKRAVFLTENAYFNGKLDWNEFNSEIDRITQILKQMIAKKGLNGYKTSGNWAIFTYMSDSIPENKNFPYTYDYENFMGDNDFLSFTVSNLLKTHKGNCHSLPYFYKILANELNVEAFLATAPMHVFIKHKDEKGNWWNLEMTSGTFSRTSFLIESFNISDAGIMSGLYLKPLDEKETIALCILDLLSYYEKVFGIYSDKFVFTCYQKGIEYYPNSNFQIWKLNDQKHYLDNEMEKTGISDYSKIPEYPKLEAMYNEMEQTRLYLAEIGLSHLTPEQYEQKVMEIKNNK